MSLIKRGKIWHSRIIFKGLVYTNSTRQTDKAKAKIVESRIRDRLTNGAAPDVSPLTLEDVATAWWEARGVHLASAPTLEWRLRTLRRCLDHDRPITEITTAIVAEAMSVRRAETTHNSRKPTASTVNRDILDTLRPVINYASDVLELPGLPRINWKALRLAEPKERVREFSEKEIEAIRAALPVHHRALFDFISTFGVRLREAWFPLDNIDVEGRRIHLRKRKGGDWHSLPMSDEWARELGARIGRARAAKLDTVWYWTDDAGKLHALAPSSFQSYMRETLIKLGIKDARPAHDLRHHAASCYVRRTGSLAGAKRLLGHQNIATTSRYAHASEQDVREGLFGPETTPIQPLKKETK